jgi:type III secretion protein V
MTMGDKLTNFLNMMSRRGDLVIASVVLVAVIMMIIPLPTWLVDLLITTNIGTSMLILLVAFYINTPLQFSSLPSVVLIATLFRLAITITTARLILLQANAGEVVNAFGHFVVGGNVGVGLVIFLIIAIAQFVVITKGSERVAEVAARFSLDAMPGKQMSIDSDLRNGDITQAEARRLRRMLERESHLYGAMDGAMKFVKGDAIASLIIILVNLLGGLTVGMMQHGLSFAEAVEKYSLLTVGDGLVAQIPALLLSVAAGTVVTRVGSEEQADLGHDIIRQLIHDERALFLAGAILAAISVVPGFPTYVFLAFALLLAGGGYFVYRRNSVLRAVEAPTEAGQPTTTVTHPATGQAPAAEAAKESKRNRIVAVVGPALGKAINNTQFQPVADKARAALAADPGVTIPPIDLSVDPLAEPDAFRIELEEVPVVEGEIYGDNVLADDEQVHLDLANVPYDIGLPLINRREAYWVENKYLPLLKRAGIRYLTPTEALGKCIAHMLTRYTTQFIGIQETREFLTAAEAELGELAREVQKVASVQKLAEILRRLVEENVPIRNKRLIFEALVEWGQREQDVVLLVEYVRMALGRQICHRMADRNRIIPSYVLERAVEEMLRQAVKPTAVGAFLSIAEENTRPIIEQLRQLMSAADPDVHPVVLASMDIRRHVRNLLVRSEIEIPVLSYQELAPEFSVQPLATIFQEMPIGMFASDESERYAA